MGCLRAFESIHRERGSEASKLLDWRFQTARWCTGGWREDEAPAPTHTVHGAFLGHQKKAPLVSVCPPPDSWPRRLVSLNSKAIDLTLEGCEKIRMTRCKRKYPLLLAGSERSAHNTTYSASFGVWPLPSRRRGLTCSLGLEVDRIRWVARDTFSSVLERRREVDGSPHNRSRRADPALRIRLEFHDS